MLVLSAPFELLTKTWPEGGAEVLQNIQKKRKTGRRNEIRSVLANLCLSTDKSTEFDYPALKPRRNFTSGGKFEQLIENMNS